MSKLFKLSQKAFGLEYLMQKTGLPKEVILDPNFDLTRMRLKKVKVIRPDVPREITMLDNEVLNMYKSGAKVKDIAFKFNVTNQMIYLRLNRMGIRKEIKYEERKCLRCETAFECRARSNQIYCSKWCSKNRNLTVNGKKKCNCCKLYYDLDFFSSLTRCRSCSTNKAKQYRKNNSSYRHTIKKYLDYPKNQDKVKAWGKLNWELKKGSMTKQPCEECGSIENIHAHHDDYSKPLEVRWLCAYHHKMHHKKLKSGDKFVVDFSNQMLK